MKVVIEFKIDTAACEEDRKDEVIRILGKFINHIEIAGSISDQIFIYDINNGNSIGHLIVLNRS